MKAMLKLANALRLDLIVDDQMVNCAEVISASSSKARASDRGPVARRVVPAEDIERLVVEKYSQRDWNYRF